MSWYVENGEDVVGPPARERPRQRKGKPVGYGRASFHNWSGLLSRKGDSLQRALGIRVGRILGCGKFGCTVESSPKKVMKLSPLPEQGWDDDEELKFWTKMKAEQRRPESPASEGVVKIDHVWVITDKQTGEKYMAVLRDAVDPFITVEPGHVLVPTPTTVDAGLGEIPRGAATPDDLRWMSEDVVEAIGMDKLLEPVVVATKEYRLGDVHLGNIGWRGGRLVIYDADYWGEAPDPDDQLRVNRRRQDPSQTGRFRDWDDFLVKKGANLSRALGVPLKRILGCGALGCVVESSPGKVVKLTEAAAHRALDGSIGDELAFWTHMKAEQSDPDSPASKGVVRVFSVNVIEDRDTGNKYVAVVREAVTPAAATSETGWHSWTPATNRRVCGREQCEIAEPWQRWPLAANALRAVRKYELEDVHSGNIGWRGDDLVVFDAHTDIQYLEPDEMKRMRVNRAREVQERVTGAYEPTFNEWSRLIADKGDDLQEALGVTVGDIVGCGAFGCVVASEPGKVIKLSSFRAHGGGDEELSFWTKMKSEQKRTNSPASKGVVKIDKVALIEDKDTGEEYIAVLRDAVEPLLLHGGGAPSDATTSRISRDAVKMLRETWHWQGLPAAAGANEAVQEYGLHDVHAGNLGWSGDRLVVYDGHMRDEPEDEDIDLRLRVNDAYSPFREHLQGGVASGMSPEDFDPEQLARGIEVELEHTQDRVVAAEIAMDHLVEDPRYYEKLEAMEMRANVGERLEVWQHLDRPDEQGRHPRYKHLVQFEVEPHYGSYILTATGHSGSALISEDDATDMFGEQLEHGFAYLSDEYLELLAPTRAEHRDILEPDDGGRRISYVKNASRFYVFEMRGGKPYRQVNVKPLTLARAQQLARIGAQNGKHDRVVTTDPRKGAFEIKARYKAGAR